MRKIYNDETLQQKISDFNDTLFSKRGFNHPTVDLPAFLAEAGKSVRFDNFDEALMNAYLQKLIDEYSRIIHADQETMMELIAEFELIIPHGDLPDGFADEIVSHMRYEDLRKKEFLELIQSLGIKNCVYCHAHLAITIDKGLYSRNNPARQQVAGQPRVRRGLFQLDHRYAKSKYPFLSTTFYNLYPVCANCNSIKHDSDSDFNLYSETPDVELFNFCVTEESVISYLANNDHQLLAIQIHHRNMTDDEAEAYLSMFDIKEIYNTQKDVVEELVHKKVVYNDKYKKELHDEFLALFPDQAMINRLIIGNYDQPEDVHKRPMAKFVQDIARDLGLIPKLPEI